MPPKQSHDANGDAGLSLTPANAAVLTSFLCALEITKVDFHLVAQENNIGYAKNA